MMYVLYNGKYIPHEKLGEIPGWTETIDYDWLGGHHWDWWADVLRGGIKESIFMRGFTNKTGLEMTGHAWMHLLWRYPELYYLCDYYQGWRKLDGFDWVFLLTHEDEMFAERCAEKCKKLSGFDKIDDEGWECVLASHPEYSIYRGGR